MGKTGKQIKSFGSKKDKRGKQKWTKKAKEKRKQKLAQQTRTYERAAPEDEIKEHEDLIKFDDDEDVQSRSEDLNDIQSDIGMDLSDQDEVENQELSEGDEDVDIEKELLLDYQEDPTKKRKSKKVSEEEDEDIQEMDEILDDKSSSKTQQIRKLLEIVDDESKITTSIAARLLGLFRMTIKISTDNSKKGKDEQEDEEQKQKVKTKDKETEIILSSNPTLYKQVIEMSVTKLPKVLLKLFKEEINLDELTEENYKKIKRLYATAKQTQTILMRSFISNYLKLLKGGSEPESIQMFLCCVVDCVKFAFPFQVYRKIFTKTLCDIMCRYYEVRSEVILVCFDALRKLIMWNEFVKDDLTTYAYKQFLNAFGDHSRIGGAGATKAKTRENLRLLENCFCELLSIDYIAAYQVGFGLIRKLALVCRSVRKDFNEKEMRRIINWQFHHYLHLLSVILFTLTLKSTELELLIYPYIQVCIATMGITMKTTKNFPFTIKICKMLNNLNKVAPKVYIPVAQYILHLFTGTDDFLNRKTKSAKEALPNFEVALKLSKDFYDKTETKDYVFKSCIEELKNHLEIIKRSMSFPELVIPICHTLGQFKKRCINPPYYNIIRELYGKIRKVTDKLQEYRKSVDLTSIEGCEEASAKLDLGN